MALWALQPVFPLVTNYFHSFLIHCGDEGCMHRQAAQLIRASVVNRFCMIFHLISNCARLNATDEEVEMKNYQKWKRNKLFHKFSRWRRRRYETSQWEAYWTNADAIELALEMVLSLKHQILTMAECGCSMRMHSVKVFVRLSIWIQVKASDYQSKILLLLRAQYFSQYSCAIHSWIIVCNAIRYFSSFISLFLRCFVAALSVSAKCVKFE